MGFYQYFRERVSAILEYANNPKPDVITQGSWNDIVSTQSECLEDLTFLKNVYDGMSQHEKETVDATIKKSEELPKLLQQQFHGVTVADKVVKLIVQNPTTRHSMELGDLSRYLASFPNGSKSSDTQDLRA